MEIFSWIVFAACLLTLIAMPLDKKSLDHEFTEHRIDLLENGFNVFADEFVTIVQKLQQKVQAFTDTNNELRKQVQEVTTHDSELTKTVKEQDKVISDLLWAVADIKERRAQNMNTQIGELRQQAHTDKDELVEIEWTLFDLKHSTDQILEEMCLNEATCDDWSKWSACSVECGTGSSFRSRNCSKVGKFQSYCDPVLTETQECRGTRCETATHLTCPKSFVYLKGYCLRFSGRSDNHALAKLICETDNGHLVEMDTPRKHAIVMEYLKEEVTIFMKYAADNPDVSGYTDFTYIDDTSPVAIDGIQYGGEGRYLNWRQQSMNYFRWAKGEPRDLQQDEDSCITVNLEDYYWYTSRCAERFYYVCEAPLMGPQITGIDIKTDGHT